MFLLWETESGKDLVAGKGTTPSQNKSVSMDPSEKQETQVDSATHKYFRRQEHQDLHNSSIAVVLREMQHEINESRPLKTRFALIIVKITIPSISAQQTTLIVAS